jgi:predicted TIM-barrel fold metal-dependent hydrolase
VAEAYARAARAAPYSGPIFDCDTHLYEVEDAWSRYLPAKYVKDWNVAFRHGPDGEFGLFIGDRKVEIAGSYYTPDGRVPAPGKLHEWLRAMKEGRSEIGLRIDKTPDMYDREARLAKLDEFGVEGCILYVGNMVGTISYLDEIEPAYAYLDAYNRWLEEDWGFHYKERIFATPVITLDSLEHAIAQAKWAVSKGVRAVLMPMGPFGGRSPADPYFDPFWSILNEAHVRVVYHVSEAIYLKPHMAIWGERMQTSRLFQSAFVWMHGYSERPVVETLSSLIFWNFFKRFPNIRVMSAENGAEWAPAMLRKMDKVRGVAKNGYWPAGQLTERPSTIFKQHVAVVAYPEDDIADIVEQAGTADFLVMGSDYPHSEGVAEPRQFVREALSSLDPRQVQAIMYDNGKRFIQPTTGR